MPLKTTGSLTFTFSTVADLKVGLAHIAGQPAYSNPKVNEKKMTVTVEMDVTTPFEGH